MRARVGVERIEGRWSVGDYGLSGLVDLAWMFVWNAGIGVEGHTKDS